MTDKFDPARLRELHEAIVTALDLLDNVTAATDSEADFLGQAENLLRNAAPAILAQATENAALKAEVARLREVVGEIRDLPGEINPSNYDHDDACELNRQFCYAISVASTALAGGDHD